MVLQEKDESLADRSRCTKNTCFEVQVSQTLVSGDSDESDSRSVEMDGRTALLFRELCRHDGLKHSISPIIL